MPHSIHTKRLNPQRARLLNAAALVSVVTLAVAGCGSSSSPHRRPPLLRQGHLVGELPRRQLGP